MGPGVIFTNDYFPRADNKSWKIKKTLINFGASIGANSTILCGVKIGKRAMVAAGSVVTKDIKDFELYAGNPAVLKKKIKK
ncbi:N-acetyltransferase [Candidatus Pelagibacter sp.]|nr:N-acetyltransferase [Candidatus Pelagibacter sp.]